MQRIDVDDLPDLAGVLVECSTGEGSLSPVGPFVVDLDGVDEDTAVRVAARLAGRATPLLVGRSSVSLSDGFAPLLSRLTLTLAPGGPNRSWVAADDDALTAIEGTVAGAPVAAAAFAGVLLAGRSLEVADGLALESATYSMLLGSDEFLQWRSKTPAKHVLPVGDQVRVHRDGNDLCIEFDRPECHNAFGHVMRDQLLEALALADLDNTITTVRLTGRGDSFCSGGDLGEFGSADSPALAHLVRVQQCAGLAVHGLRDRIRPLLHGACIGAGIEIPAFADYLVAQEGTWFQLPELAFGLIPGAGGTVSIPRRIGRWRTAFLALSGVRLGLDEALNWGLIDGRA